MGTDTQSHGGGGPLHVMLAYAPLGLVRATAQELHLGGMVIDTGTVTLSEESDVEVSFTHRHNGEFITHRIDATVTRSFRGGATLAFRSYARTTLHVLRGLIEGRHMPDLRHIGSIPRVNAVLRPGSSLPFSPSDRT